MIARLVLLTVVASGLAIFVACSETPASNPTPAVPAARPTATATATPIPAPTATPIVPFEESLSVEDHAKFESLPVEFQNTLRQEALETGDNRARQYLRHLPDDSMPIADILSQDALRRFNELGEKYQRQVLLEGYPNSNALAYRDRMTEQEARFALFETQVVTTHGLVFVEGIEPLPPLEETLSASALAKLESLDPVMQDSFRLMWENESAGPYTITTKTTDLQTRLHAAPTKLPAIEELGFSDTSIRVLRELPDLKDIVVQFVAGNLLRRGAWTPQNAENLNGLIERFGSPEGMVAFARGVMPEPKGSPYPLACNYWPQMGVKLPDRMVPAPFRDVPSWELYFYWPPLEDTLSEAALAIVRALDPDMRETLDVYYYGTGNLPKTAREMICGVARWERSLTDVTTMSAPTPEALLSPEVFALYEQLSDSGKEVTTRRAMFNILRGEVWLQQEGSQSLEVVSSLTNTSEEFFEALQTWADEWVREWACNVEELGCGDESP